MDYKKMKKAELVELLEKIEEKNPFNSTEVKESVEEDEALRMLLDEIVNTRGIRGCNEKKMRDKLEAIRSFLTLKVDKNNKEQLADLIIKLDIKLNERFMQLYEKNYLTKLDSEELYNNVKKLYISCYLKYDGETKKFL